MGVKWPAYLAESIARPSTMWRLNLWIQKHHIYQQIRTKCIIYVRILGSNQEVVRLIWLIKYFSPALVMACSQPSGNVRSWPIVDEVTGFVTGDTVNTKIYQSLDQSYKFVSNRTMHYGFSKMLIVQAEKAVYNDTYHEISPKILC